MSDSEKDAREWYEARASANRIADDAQVTTWRARVRMEFGPGADDLTPEEEREYEKERPWSKSKP